MPCPKKRLTRSRRGKRRAHDSISFESPSTCKNCGSLIRPHRVCPSCGYYKGREVVPASAE